VNSITKKTLAIIASGAIPALAFAGSAGGGAEIGPVNGSGTEGPQTSNSTQKTAVQANQFGTMPPNASAGMSGGKQTTSVNAKSKTTSKTSTNTNRGGR